MLRRFVARKLALTQKRNNGAAAADIYSMKAILL
jgi:hypothetical protein